MLKIPDISIEQLKAFVAVAELKSFSLAAKQLFRTQSAVSVQVANLEAVLDCQLFARANKTITLTDAGDIFLSYADKIFLNLDHATQAVSDLKNKVSGRLVIST